MIPKKVKQIIGDDPISGSNPMPVEEVVKFSVINAIESTNFDLNAAAYSVSTNITSDYELDSLHLHFSTAESRIITISDANGTILGGTDDTSDQNILRNNTDLNIIIPLSDEGYNADDNITVAITQTSGACTVDVVLKIKQGVTSVSSGDNVILGSSTANIGRVNVLDSSNNLINPAKEDGNLASILSGQVGSTVVSGRKTVSTAGTAETLGSSTTLTQGLIIMALKDNTNNIFVGDSSIDKDTDKQMELEPGEATAISIDNLNKVYIDVTTDGEGVSFLGS